MLHTSDHFLEGFVGSSSSGAIVEGVRRPVQSASTISLHYGRRVYLASRQAPSRALQATTRGSAPSAAPQHQRSQSTRPSGVPD